MALELAALVLVALCDDEDDELLPPQAARGTHTATASRARWICGLSMLVPESYGSMLPSNLAVA